MYFSICFLVVLTLASIPCDAQFGPFGENDGNDFMIGFEGMDMERMGMGGMGMGGIGMGGMGMEGMDKGGMGMGKGGMSEIGNWAPLIPTDDERKMCEVEANDQGQKLENTFKKCDGNGKCNMMGMKEMQWKWEVRCVYRLKILKFQVTLKCNILELLYESNILT
ncbi:hypothetical protein AVEN_3039-1 [Araneus ventricosus]|uniref:Uncharacterized protein n=1 Tax=Araneus ventricosus TaxID=182803 RepID=A0A4Y2NL49_ARAVE|nr:hypothetical protein AVEN_3039-1 [Araneus ventricosus]